MAEVEDYEPVDFGGRQYLPDDFKEYVDRELNCLSVGYGSILGWVFWSREDHEPDYIVDLKTKIKDVLPKFICHAGDFVLVQFWAPIKTTEGRFSLTTQNQPFALCNPLGTEIVRGVDIKGLCEYRMICKDYKFYTDGAEEELGVPGRVFKHRLPESTPNVKYYSMREYPLRDRALRCQVTQSLAVPVFEPSSSQMCVGVLEFITTASPHEYVFFECYLKENVDLIFSVPLEHREQLITGEKQALDEITEVLEVVCKTHDLPGALAWTSCKVDMACRTLVNDDILYGSCFFRQDIWDPYWAKGVRYHLRKGRYHLRKGQGVAGRAFSSRNILLCADLTQLSITEYPLAHYARHEGLRSCFAICLQSRCTGNDLYVLEFFMPLSNKALGNPETTLILCKIFETMKEKFWTFKLASRKELGEELRIEEIQFENGEKLDDLQMSQITRSLLGLVDFNSLPRGREYFPDDFKVYVDRELNCSTVEYCEDDEFDGSIIGWVFWSREDHESGDIVDFKNKIKDVVLPRCTRTCNDFTLVQFWAPIKTMEGRFSLTTQNQPFALCTPLGPEIVRGVDIKGLCEYSMICKDYKFCTDGAEEELGVPGRVFKHQLPESTPNVEYYSITEYPLRHHALRCQVTQSLAVPVFEPSAQMCVGVLEFVTTTDSLRKLQILEDDVDKYFSEDIKAEGLIVSFPDALHYNYNQLITGEQQAVDEVKEVLEVVCEVHDLPGALAWTSCKVDMARRALVNNDILFVRCKYNNYGCFNFERVSHLHPIKKGQGVAGRAFSSPNVLLCKDLTQLSIIDYPLAHYARDAKLSCCFAICLQSSCTGNDLYVLEFFMPPPSNIARGDSETTLILRKILETMKKKFQTFKLASGKELGEELRIEEIHFQNGEKLNSLQMSHTTTFLPGPEPSQSGGEMMLLDSSDQQSMDALNSGSNVPSAEQSNIDATCSQEKGIKKMPKRVHKKTGVKIEIPLEDILRTSKMCLKDAANNLKVSRSTLKRVCRDHDIQRWPPRMKNMVGRCQPSESSPCVDHNQIPHLSSDLPSSQASATVVHTNPNNKVIQGANTVTVRANYINDIIKFRLSLPSRLVELQHQISKRLHLETGTYCVKYEDEDNYKILIGCDEDLQDCISTSRSLGSTSIMLFIEPK